MRLNTLAAANLALCLLAAASATHAATSKVGAICQADFQKLCPDAPSGRGAVMRCVKGRLDAVSADCKTAVVAAQDRAAQRKAAKLAAKTSSTPAPQ